MLAACGPDAGKRTEGVDEITAALGSGYNHCIIVPDPAGSTHWIETGYCLESSEIAVCRDVLSTDCKKGRYGLNTPYTTCNTTVDTNACK
jgi:hypothetical protein